MPTPNPKRHVAIAFPISVPWMAKFVRGVTDYADQQGGWLLTASPPTLTWAGEQMMTLDSLQGWPGDGVIGALATQAEIKAANRLNKPLVNMSATLKNTGFPRVMPDHKAMGRLAAEHFLERGVRRFAYYGIDGLWFSQQRCDGFVDRVQQAGFSCEILNMPAQFSRRQNWGQRLLPLTRWLGSLKPPIGLLAIQDYRARTVMDECRRIGLRVPHDVAVIGMDEDPAVCEFCSPTLTSVLRNSRQVGYQTAALLDRLMDGEPPPSEDIVIEPSGMVARQSSDTIAVEDGHVAAAVHFVRDHSAQPFGVDEVVRATEISRRQLEVRFRNVLRCTIYDYLCQERLKNAKEMLKRPERIKLNQIAKACGFATPEQMRLVFKRFEKRSPMQYRNSKAP